MEPTNSVYPLLAKSALFIGDCHVRISLRLSDCIGMGENCDGRFGSHGGNDNGHAQMLASGLNRRQATEDRVVNKDGLVGDN